MVSIITVTFFTFSSSGRWNRTLRNWRAANTTQLDKMWHLEKPVNLDKARGRTSHQDSEHFNWMKEKQKTNQSYFILWESQEITSAGLQARDKYKSSSHDSKWQPA